MKTRRFALVLRRLEEGAQPYVSEGLYTAPELRSYVNYLHTLHVEVVNIIPVDIDLSVPEY